MNGCLIELGKRFVQGSRLSTMVEKTHKLTLSALGGLFRRSFLRLRLNDPLRMAGATAFFTSFALPPIMILLFQLFTIFIDRKVIGGEFRQALESTLGTDGANQVRNTIQGFRALTENPWAAGFGLLFLCFVATTLFNVIKSTFNDIWNVRLERAGFLYDMRNRGRSLLVILAAGMLMLAGILIDAFEVFTGKYLARLWSDGSVFFLFVFGHLIGVVIVTIWFVVLFRYLANARPSWRVSLAGGIVTGVLFSIGKAVLSHVLLQSNAGAIYGASGSIVLILLFVFYSSFILYFGASFVKEYGIFIGQPVRLSRRAYHFEMQKIATK